MVKKTNTKSSTSSCNASYWIYFIKKILTLMRRIFGAYFKAMIIIMINLKMPVLRVTLQFSYVVVT